MAGLPLAILPREYWGAHPPQHMVLLKHPCTYVFCMNTHSEQCFNEYDCKSTIRRMQDIQMSKKFFRDIRFNFLIAGDGNVYEGRGWLHAGFLPDKYKEFNDDSIVIGFVGTYTEADLPAIMIKRRNELVTYGMQKSYISRDFKPYEIFVKRDNMV